MDFARGIYVSETTYGIRVPMGHTATDTEPTGLTCSLPANSPGVLFLALGLSFFRGKQELVGDVPGAHCLCLIEVDKPKAR